MAKKTKEEIEEEEKRTKNLKVIFEEMQFLKDQDLQNPSDELSAESVQWYQDNAINVYEQMFSTNQKNSDTKKKVIKNSIDDYGSLVRYTGRLYTFMYQPESERLDYWDKFPLVLRMIDESDSRTSFMGINIHYLDPVRRRLLFMSLVEHYMTGNISSPNSRIGFLDIQKLVNPPNRYGRPCIRRYKHNNIRGRALMIPPEHWMKMIFLPTYHFVGAKPNNVWKQTWKKYLRG